MNRQQRGHSRGRPIVSEAQRWARRGILAALILLALLGGARSIWGMLAQQRLNRAIAAAQRAGEPIWPQDFVSPPVPDELNAVLDFRAAQGQQPQTERLDLNEMLAEIQQDPERIGSYQDHIDRRREALARVRQGRMKSQSHWDVQLSVPMINTLLPHLTGLRATSSVVAIAAVLEAQAGRADRMFEHLADLNALALSANDCPTIVTAMVAQAIDAYLIQVIEWAAPELPTATGEDRARIESWIAALTSDEAPRARLRRALQFERASMLEVATLAASGHLSLAGLAGGEAPPARWVGFLQALFVGPALTSQGARMFEKVSIVADAAGRESWPAARGAMQPGQPAQSQFSIERILMPSLENAVKVHFRDLAGRRMAALALALRLYELDHGARPAALDALVPRYLPALPRDPFAETERSFGYVPAAPDGARLYSVGDNGRDEGGRFNIKDGRVDLDGPDVPFFLERKRPRSSSGANRELLSKWVTSQPTAGATSTAAE